MIHIPRTGYESDVRGLLPSITVAPPSCIVIGDRHIRLRAARYLADRIRNAKFVVLPGDDHLCCVGDSKSWWMRSRSS
jgi:hypothetical protein